MKMFAAALLSLGLLLSGQALAQPLRGTCQSQSEQERQARWQKLPPEKRQELMQRYERYQQLPPAEREALKQRYQQFKQLPPEEKKAMKQRWQEEKRGDHGERGRDKGHKPGKGDKSHRPSDRGADR